MAMQTVPRRGVCHLGYLLLALALWSGRGSLVRAEPPAAPPLTAEQKARLKERDRYAAEARKLWNVGKRAEAIAAWEKKVAIERAVLGKLHDEVFASLGILAHLQETREDYPAARKVRQAILAGRIKRYGEKDWRVTDARIDLEDVDRLSRLDEESRKQIHQAEALHSLSKNLHRAEKYRQAIPVDQQVLAIRKRILGEHHPEYAASLAWLALQYQAMGDYPKALPLLQQARKSLERG